MWFITQLIHTHKFQLKTTQYRPDLKSALPLIYKGGLSECFLLGPNWQSTLYLLFIFQNPGEFNTSGLIFSGNKFACKPTLPFNAFAMPSYDAINQDSKALVRQGHLSEQVYKKIQILFTAKLKSSVNIKRHLIFVSHQSYGQNFPNSNLGFGNIDDLFHENLRKLKLET